jgi:hypothetical protein
MSSSRTQRSARDKLLATVAADVIDTLPRGLAGGVEPLTTGAAEQSLVGVGKLLAKPPTVATASSASVGHRLGSLPDAIADQRRPSGRNEPPMATAPAALGEGHSRVGDVAQDLSDAVPVPGGAARTRQLGHAFGVESPCDVSCGEPTGRVHLEDATDRWSDFLVDRNRAIRIPDVAAGHLADHLTALGRVPVRVTNFLAGHAPLHRVSCSQGRVHELTCRRPVESTVHKDNLDFGPLLHERIEVQGI